jgi:hypothetical protein
LSNPGPSSTKPSTGAGVGLRPQLRIEKGRCLALFAYDVALSIDLDKCDSRITALKQRAQLKQSRRAPRYIEYTPAPLRVSTTAAPVEVAKFHTTSNVDLVIFDFGSVSVTYTIPLKCDLDDLVRLSDALYDNAALLGDSRRQVETLLAGLQDAVSQRHSEMRAETYSIFQIEEVAPHRPTDELYANHRHVIAQILRAETSTLSAQEVDDATSARVSFGADDLALIDWNGAVLFDRDANDVIAVLEFANVELLEMCWLDQQLDRALDEAYEALNRRSWRRNWLPGKSGADLRRVARLQVDSALLFEGVNNTLKLVGDQYLARAYRLISARLHLDEWDTGILRKLTSLESIYQKMSDVAATWRLELLEWIIIILIAVSIVIPFIPGVPH